MKHHDSFTFTEILKLRKTTRYFILHHSGVSEQPTEAQIKATVTLLYRLGHLYPNAKICRHSDFNKSKNCPGKNFPFEELKHRVSQSLP